MICPIAMLILRMTVQNGLPGMARDRHHLHLIRHCSMRQSAEQCDGNQQQKREKITRHRFRRQGYNSKFMIYRIVSQHTMPGLNTVSGPAPGAYQSLFNLFGLAADTAPIPVSCLANARRGGISQRGVLVLALSVTVTGAHGNFPLARLSRVRVR